MLRYHQPITLDEPCNRPRTSGVTGDLLLLLGSGTKQINTKVPRLVPLGRLGHVTPKLGKLCRDTILGGLSDPLCPSWSYTPFRCFSDIASDRDRPLLTPAGDRFLPPGLKMFSRPWELKFNPSPPVLHCIFCRPVLPLVMVILGTSGAKAISLGETVYRRELGCIGCEKGGSAKTSGSP